jgi:hypothetical protein
MTEISNKTLKAREKNSLSPGVEWIFHPMGVPNKCRFIPLP